MRMESNTLSTSPVFEAKRCASLDRVKLIHFLLIKSRKKEYSIQ